jgi:nucleotide-binding universal stress UspA family protein
MFKNVLVGVDGRSNGRDAIALARQLTDPHGVLTLTHVHRGALRRSHLVSPSFIRDEQAESESLLESERANAGVNAEVCSAVALSPGRGLHELAEDRGCDLIVVGSSSHGMFGRVLLGDDTLAALNGAPCAVAVASRGYAEQPAAIAEIGVGYDGSPESTAALEAARRLGAGIRASVRVLEVISIPTYSSLGYIAPLTEENIDEALREAAGRIESLRADTRVEDLPDFQGSAVYGMIGEELATLGDEVNLLVVGSRSYGPFRRMMLGSTSGYLARHARCPLLVLPRAPAEAAVLATEQHEETALA